MLIQPGSDDRARILAVIKNGFFSSEQIADRLNIPTEVVKLHQRTLKAMGVVNCADAGDGKGGITHHCYLA